MALDAAGCDVPVILRRTYNGLDAERFQRMQRPTLALRSSMDSETASGLKGRDCPAVAQFNGIRDSASDANAHLKTEYISCPSCGRTLFDLQETTAKIREVTSHLKGNQIGIMGCIVNGPGENADADYGYVGTGPGKITLYKEKEVGEKRPGRAGR